MKAQKIKPVLIHEVHDMWPATLTEIGEMSKRHPFVLLMQAAENSAYRKSDFIVSLPPLTKDYMVCHGMRPDKYRAIQNGIVLDDWETPNVLPEAYSSLLGKLREEGKYLVGYCGGFALSNALDLLLDAAKKLDANRFHVVMVGDGIEKKALLDRILSEQITNISILPAVPKKAIPSFLQSVDCCYIGAKDSPLYQFGISANKIFDYMMSGKPTVIAINLPTSPIEEHQCGLAVKTNNADDIAQAIKTVSQYSDEDLHALSDRAIAAVKTDYSYKALSKKFKSLFTLQKSDNEPADKLRNKKILLINHYAGSIDMGMEYRPYYMAREWINDNCQVNIFAGEFSHLRKTNPTVKHDFQCNNIDDINYYWFKSGRYVGNGIKRAISMIRFVVKLWWYAPQIARKFCPDVIITSSTYPLDTYAAQRIARKCR